MPRSNNMGRSFEFMLCDQIARTFPNIKFTERAFNEQQRDAEHFFSLNHLIQEEYIKSAEIICNTWLVDKINKYDLYSLDRLPDRAGVKGDVTDICIKNYAEQINISLKHNHDALKHPRISRVPAWVGIQKDHEYMRIHDQIWEDFFDAAAQLNPNAVLFKDLINIEKDFVNDNLYFPFCKLISSYLNQFTSEPVAIQQMFDFLIGNCNFYKIIDRKHFIEIQEFINIPKPPHVEICQTSKSYISINFDNGVSLSLRIHTAEKELTASAKFDVRGRFENLPIIEIQK